ncbi:MAG TPA: LLM class flavin-dependent oxidoreductase [Gaiellaceae bacterium]|nr:LLM class flavin-dependent oxidoreductase [Gaiellaceae bacterium]
MRFGLDLCTLGAFADPRETVRVAREAEEAGWEALLVWDHLAWASLGAPSADPWVTLGACAAVTSRLLLGTAVTPVARRRVQNLAQELATLSHASGGRVVFGAGLGALPAEFAAFGEETDERVRAARLDDGLGRLRTLLSGEALDGLTLRPLPLREIPFWIGGMSSRARARAARWDGWLVDGSDQDGNTVSPERLGSMLHGHSIDEVCFIGYSGQADLPAYAAAGATWWLENVHGDPEDVVRRVRKGPPGETLLT